VPEHSVELEYILVHDDVEGTTHKVRWELSSGKSFVVSSHALIAVMQIVGVMSIKQLVEWLLIDTEQNPDLNVQIISSAVNCNEAWIARIIMTSSH
jgi:hypothetical protein